ncbi:MAG: hypothetical protein Q8M54_04860 [Desulfobaccales bacterium]|nr:hypothetical protein [Desulfobaccales bacterium]
MNIDNLTLTRLAAELRLAVDKCPKCQGAREHLFISRGAGKYRQLPPVRADLQAPGAH